MLTKDRLLAASDLIEKEVELPTLGDKVRVRSLPAAYASDAQYRALEMTVTEKGEQVSRIDSTKAEAIQVLHGLIEPKFDTLEEVQRFQKQCGPAWQTIVKAINDISGIDQEAVKKTVTSFPAGEPGEKGASEVNGARAGDRRPDIPARASA